MSKTIKNFWTAYLNNDKLPDFDKIKESLEAYNMLKENVSIVYSTITGIKDIDITSNPDEVIRRYEENMSKVLVEKPKDIDLDFAEGDDWISWANTNIEKCSSDEQLIVKYHEALFAYIQNQKIIIQALSDLKNEKTLKKIKEGLNGLIEEYN